MAIDLYRVVSVMLNPGKYLSALLDLLFWGISALAAFQYLLASSAGARGYMVLALAVGVCAEQIAIGHYIRRWGFVTLRLLVQVLRMAVAVLARVLDVSVGAIAMPVLWVCRRVIAVMKLAEKSAARKIFSIRAGKSRALEK